MAHSRARRFLPHELAAYAVSQIYQWELQMPGFKGLAVPGPSNMPFRIRQAMDIALEDHRAPDFPQFTLPLFSDLKKIFQTKNGQVFLFPVSGTGGWEFAIA